jgi:sugar phosphate isomerase/epimerase
MNHKAIDQLGWRLGAQAYTFRKLTLFETIDVLNALGLRYIEIYPGQRFSPELPDVRTDHNLTQQQIDQFRAKLKANDVAVLNYGVVDLPADEASARKVFEFAKKMGIETIVSEPKPEALDTAVKLADEYQINVAIHNHPAPSLYADCADVTKAIDGRSERIGACADTGHWYRSGHSALKCIQSLEGRIISLHFKDVNEEKRDVPWGTGQVDTKAVLVELHRQKARPFFAIEYEAGEGQELIENVAKCMHYFSAVATELASMKQD